MTSRRHFRPGHALIGVLAFATALALPEPVFAAGTARGVTPAECSAGGAADRPAAPRPPRGDAVHPTDGPDVDIRIWIEERAIRFRVEANLAFADEIVDVPREVEDQLAEVEREPLVRALFDAYREHNRVRVDGVELDPVLGDWRAIDALEEFIPLFPLTGARALIRLRMEYEYPLLSPPERVSMVWGLYPVDVVQRLGPNGPKIEVSAQLNAGGFDYPLTFTEAEPEYIWHGELPSDDEAFLPVPAPVGEPEGSRLYLASFAAGPLLLLMAAAEWRRRRRGIASVELLGGVLVLATGVAVHQTRSGPDLPDPAEAVAIFEPLHQNIYRAFRFDEEERIYDALARSVDGELLDRLYDQIYRSLVNEEEGGAVSRVEAVRHVEVVPAEIGTLDGDRAAFGVEARWQVDGAVIHWGHAHRRTQEYAALYTVAETDAGWRIVGSEILEQRIVRATPGVEEEIGAADGPAFVAPASREL